MTARAVTGPATAGWGARLGSVALMLSVGALAGLAAMGAAAIVGQRQLIYLAPAVTAVLWPLLAMLVCGALAWLCSLVSARLSGAGATVAGLLTIGLALASAGLWLYRNPGVGRLIEGLGRNGVVVASTLLMGAALLPVGTALLGSGLAAPLAARRPRGSALVAVLVAVAVPVTVVAVSWAGARYHAVLARSFVAPWSDPGVVGRFAVYVALCLLLAALVVLGGRGPWGLVAAGAMVGLGASAFLVGFPWLFRRVPMPGWVVQSLDLSAIATSPIVGALLCGAGLGLAWRSRAARDPELQRPGVAPPR